MQLITINRLTALVWMDGWMDGWKERNSFFQYPIFNYPIKSKHKSVYSHTILH